VVQSLTPADELSYHPTQLLQCQCFNYTFNLWNVPEYLYLRDREDSVCISSRTPLTIIVQVNLPVFLKYIAGKYVFERARIFVTVTKFSCFTKIKSLVMGLPTVGSDSEHTNATNHLNSQ